MTTVCYFNDEIPLFLKFVFPPKLRLTTSTYDVTLFHHKTLIQLIMKRDVEVSKVHHFLNFVTALHGISSSMFPALEYIHFELN